MTRSLVSLLVLLLAEILSSRHGTEAACYPTGSNCVPTSPFMTSVSWKDCQQYCNKCRGYAVGDCVRVFNEYCKGNFQCKCKGNKIPLTKNRLELATCQLGL
ncbi:unnamed protein product [Caenorhabditis auriculariae]|uniref:Uncharacterized protein n=1 Tax=Caenorhabditis auriculariae TaxID=2777116 RepID=A0A8S1GVQ9_9PELO|nr:unnamed protein product [Caenorhabditis auriculariae]